MTDYPIQSPRTVANRAMCLGTLLKRYGIEQGMQSVDDLPDEIREGWQREHEGIHQSLKRWCAEEKLTDKFSDDERLLIDANLGDWQQLDRAMIKWRSESLGMMLWALGVVEVPYYDTQFHIEALLEPLDLMNPTIDFMWRAELLDGKFIHKARDLAEIWHWRAQISEMQKRGDDPPEGTTFEDEIKRVANETYVAGNLPELIDDDFPVRGKAYADLEDDEFEKISAIAKERHYALNWLCKRSDDWDDVPLEVDLS